MTLGLAATLAALACESAPENSLGPEVLPPQFAANPVVQSVTGSGEIDDPISGEWRTFAFTAREYADGTVEGEYERYNRRPGLGPSHGNVTCFTIIGNQAWLGGFEEFGDRVGGDVAWRVVDNGEGKNAPPDQISLQSVQLPPGAAASYCARKPNGPPLFDVVAGNIQVRP